MSSLAVIYHVPKLEGLVFAVGIKQEEEIQRRAYKREKEEE
jgi:hypothetical protein